MSHCKDLCTLLNLADLDDLAMNAYKDVNLFSYFSSSTTALLSPVVEFWSLIKGASNLNLAVAHTIFRRELLVFLALEV